MANSFYNDACEMDTKISPWSIDIKPQQIADGNVDEDGAVTTDGLRFFHGVNSKLYAPRSLMNENVAINYRTIYNGFPVQTLDKQPFTEYNDYLRCMESEETYRQFIKDKRNPTYQNIMKYYNDENFDKEGLSRYKIQDFIYLKYFNQIPNNYMITLRRYTQPCVDHMFGLDLSAEQINTMHNRSKDYFAIATAVTYMGEQTGNKLSDILKFDYGMRWEDKTAQVNSLQSPDGGLAAQMKERAGVDASVLSGEAGFGVFNKMGSVLKMTTMSLGKGIPVSKAMASQHQYDGNEFSARYGDEFYGDINVVDSVKLRSRGLTFTNNFSLVFEYSLKSLKCVNPRIAMMDILSNFLILTGNYGAFWGGATLFFGAHNIAPQFGNPAHLRNGNYGAYISSLWHDVKQGFQNLSGHYEQKQSEAEGGNVFDTVLNIAKNILKGGLTAILGNILGGNVGVAGTAQAPPALLSGKPSGYWHVTVGNPLDPIAVMGNMAVTKTTVQFSDVLGYDDFPTEIKFTVDLEHCMPRDNAHIESMFNAGKGRFYAFTKGSLENEYHSINIVGIGFRDGDGTQEINAKGKAKHVNNHSNNTNYRQRVTGAQLYN